MKLLVISAIIASAAHSASAAPCTTSQKSSFLPLANPTIAGPCTTETGFAISVPPKVNWTPELAQKVCASKTCLDLFDFYKKQAYWSKVQDCELSNGAAISINPFQVISSINETSCATTTAPPPVPTTTAPPPVPTTTAPPPVIITTAPPPVPTSPHPKC